MKIENNKTLFDYIDNLQTINDLNMSLSEMFLSIIDNDEIVSKEELETLSKTYNRSLKEVYIDKIIDYLGIDLDEEDNQEIIDKYFINNFYEIDEEEFLNNPYYKNIKVNNVKLGKLSLVYDSYKSYEIFALDDISVDEKYVENSKLAYFKNKFPFIALNQNDITWMSITPNEIKTMQKHIENAYGVVHVFGLGLGYYAYMISLKENVNHIFIYEKDKNVIELFNKYLLPQFPYKDKITIIQIDALEAIKKPLKGDCAFVDLWHTAEDGIELFLSFKKKEQNYPNIKFSYWLDNSFYAFMRRCFISLLYEQKEGFKESEYKNSKNSFDKMINLLFYKTKNLHISSKEQIRDLLSDDNLINY